MKGSDEFERNYNGKLCDDLNNRSKEYTNTKGGQKKLHYKSEKFNHKNSY